MLSVSKREHLRTFGEHLTPRRLFYEYILPEVIHLRTQYRWVDLFAGNGDLIFPILEHTPVRERIDFFREHIFLYDIQAEKVEVCVHRAIELGIPESIARQNIRRQDTLAQYPTEILHTHLPVYHITNPPYLYLGYIAKHTQTQKYLEYFKGANEGYQDLYQIALINDLRHGIRNMIYIIPTNFLFGQANSNKIREDLLRFYWIRKAIIFEENVFEHTGTHVLISFFHRKAHPMHEPQEFDGIKIRQGRFHRRYRLIPKYSYRAGSDFKDFVSKYRSKFPLRAKYYLHLSEVKANPGNMKVVLVDSNSFSGKGYRKILCSVNQSLYESIKLNPLFLRTIDTGTQEGRAGLYFIPDEFGADGIVVSTVPYRTHPIHLFLYPALAYDELAMLKDYFNLLLEYFRALTDSEFMTTYKYSDSSYTRKYLGLSQAKSLIETFPYYETSNEEKQKLRKLIGEKDAEGVIQFIASLQNRGQLKLCP